MSESKLSRRSFFAAMSAGAGVLVAGSAHALQYRPDSDYMPLIENACSKAPEHQNLLRQIEGRMDDSVSPTERQQIIANASCPYCGCKLFLGNAVKE
jgi:hypothetical protein